MTNKSRFFLLLIAVVFAVTLYFFYVKYVPLIKAFQFMLIPILSVAIVLTAVNVRIGTLFFVFFFPLINILPYFFGIYENIPHAPTALVLFLFYFLGWLIHQVVFPSRLSFEYPIFKPLMFFSILIVISGIITFLRYTHFFPFVNEHVYELITNVNGVTTGGAITGIIFNSLNYLTGFFLFFVILNTVNSKRYVKKIIIVLFISTIISFSFGFIQYFIDLGFGNTSLRMLLRTVNATFKDPNSFGVFLAAIVPVLLGMIFFLKMWWKLLPMIVLLSAFFLLPQTGSLSGLFGVFVSFFIFSLFLLKITLDLKSANPRAFKKYVALIVVFLLVIGIGISGFLIFNNSISFDRLTKRIEFIKKEKSWDLFSSRRVSYFWNLAGRMIKDYPISGVGIGAYIIELPNYAEIYQKEWRLTDSAENYFFQVGSELGLMGLFLSLWIFLEIFRKIGVILKELLQSEKWKYVIMGISTGILMFFLSFQVHTYIGSFEIKYMFWLFVALIFYLGKESGVVEKKIRITNKIKIIGWAMIFLFSGVLLWNSTHSLSLKSRTEQFDFKQEFGFSHLEKTTAGEEFRWSEKYAGTTIKIERPVIKVPLLASHPDIQERPVKVRIYLVKDFFHKRKQLDEIEISQSIWKIYEYDLPGELSQEVLLLFEVSRTWNPLKETGTQDPRNLGIAVGKITSKF